jgi:hypothetical protein
MPSDEELVQQLGLDPENPFDESAIKVQLPMLKRQMQLESMVSQLVEDRELQALDQYWTSELDALETANGKLPIDRTGVLEYAVANGLNSPSAAYWQIAGPARAQVEKLTAEARKRVAAEPKVKKPSSTRPTAGGGTEEVPNEDPTVKAAAATEAAKILKDLGIG